MFAICLTEYHQKDLYYNSKTNKVKAKETFIYAEQMKENKKKI